MGMTMRVMRFHQGAPWMTAASSISGESCIIADKELLEANGMYLMDPQRIIKNIVPANPAMPI